LRTASNGVSVAIGHIARVTACFSCGGGGGGGGGWWILHICCYALLADLAFGHELLVMICLDFSLASPYVVAEHMRVLAAVLLSWQIKRGAGCIPTSFAAVGLVVGTVFRNYNLGLV